MNVIVSDEHTAGVLSRYYVLSRYFTLTFVGKMYQVYFLHLFWFLLPFERCSGQCNRITEDVIVFTVMCAGIYGY